MRLWRCSDAGPETGEVRRSRSSEAILDTKDLRYLRKKTVIKEKDGERRFYQITARTAESAGRIVRTASFEPEVTLKIALQLQRTTESLCLGNDRELVLETIFAGGLANHVSVAIRAKSKDALGDPAPLGTAGLEPSEHPILEILKDPRVSPVPEWAIWFGEGMSPPEEAREVASCFAAASEEDTREAGARNEPDFKVPRWDVGGHEVTGGDGPTDAAMASIMRKLFVVKERFSEKQKTGTKTAYLVKPILIRSVTAEECFYIHTRWEHIQAEELTDLLRGAGYATDETTVSEGVSRCDRCMRNLGRKERRWFSYRKPNLLAWEIDRQYVPSDTRVVQPASPLPSFPEYSWTAAGNSGRDVELLALATDLGPYQVFPTGTTATEAVLHTASPLGLVKALPERVSVSDACDVGSGGIRRLEMLMKTAVSIIPKEVSNAQPHVCARQAVIAFDFKSAPTEWTEREKIAHVNRIGNERSSYGISLNCLLPGSSPILLNEMTRAAVLRAGLEQAILLDRVQRNLDRSMRIAVTLQVPEDLSPGHSIVFFNSRFSFLWGTFFGIFEQVIAVGSGGGLSRVWTANAAFAKSHLQWQRRTWERRRDEEERKGELGSEAEPRPIPEVDSDRLEGLSVHTVATAAEATGIWAVFRCERIIREVHLSGGTGEDVVEPVRVGPTARPLLVAAVERHGKDVVGRATNRKGAISPVKVTLHPVVRVLYCYVGNAAFSGRPVPNALSGSLKTVYWNSTTDPNSAYLWVSMPETSELDAVRQLRDGSLAPPVSHSSPVLGAPGRVLSTTASEVQDDYWPKEEQRLPREMASTIQRNALFRTILRDLFATAAFAEEKEESGVAALATEVTFCVSAQGQDESFRAEFQDGSVVEVTRRRAENWRYSVDHERIREALEMCTRVPKGACKWAGQTRGYSGSFRLRKIFEFWAVEDESLFKALGRDSRVPVAPWDTSTSAEGSFPCAAVYHAQTTDRKLPPLPLVARLGREVCEDKTAHPRNHIFPGHLRKCPKSVEWGLILVRLLTPEQTPEHSWVGPADPGKTASDCSGIHIAMLDSMCQGGLKKGSRADFGIPTEDHWFRKMDGSKYHSIVTMEVMRATEEIGFVWKADEKEHPVCGVNGISYDRRPLTAEIGLEIVDAIHGHRGRFRVGVYAFPGWRSGSISIGLGTAALASLGLCLDPPVAGTVTFSRFSNSGDQVRALTVSKVVHGFREEGDGDAVCAAAGIQDEDSCIIPGNRVFRISCPLPFKRGISVFLSVGGPERRKWRLRAANGSGKVINVVTHEFEWNGLVEEVTTGQKRSEPEAPPVELRVEVRCAEQTMQIAHTRAKLGEELKVVDAAEHEDGVIERFGEFEKQVTVDIGRIETLCQNGVIRAYSDKFAVYTFVESDLSNVRLTIDDTISPAKGFLHAIMRDNLGEAERILSSAEPKRCHGQNASGAVMKVQNSTVISMKGASPSLWEKIVEEDKAAYTKFYKRPSGSALWQYDIFRKIGLGSEKPAFIELAGECEDCCVQEAQDVWRALAFVLAIKCHDSFTTDGHRPKRARLPPAGLEQIDFSKPIPKKRKAKTGSAEDRRLIEMVFIADIFAGLYEVHSLERHGQPPILEAEGMVCKRGNSARGRAVAALIDFNRITVPSPVPPMIMAESLEHLNNQNIRALFSFDYKGAFLQMPITRELGLFAGIRAGHLSLVPVVCPLGGGPWPGRWCSLLYPHVSRLRTGPRSSKDFWRDLREAVKMDHEKRIPQTTAPTRDSRTSRRTRRPRRPPQICK